MSSEIKQITRTTLKNYFQSLLNYKRLETAYKYAAILQIIFMLDNISS